MRGQGWLGEREAGERPAAPVGDGALPSARVMAWNILHGGGTRRTPEIALTLATAVPDIVVLIEFRPTLGGQLLGVLADRGLVHTRWSVGADWRGGGADAQDERRDGGPGPVANRVVVASRWALEDAPAGRQEVPPGLESRVLGVRVPAIDLVLTGVHLPDDSRPALARAAWSWLAGVAIFSQESSHLVIGDLNASRDRGPGGAHRVAGYAAQGLGRMWTAGYRDAHTLGEESPETTWKARSGKGLRLDHALVSAALSGRVRGAAYVHEPRNQRVSDHSALVVLLGGGGDPAGDGRA